MILGNREKNMRCADCKTCGSLIDARLSRCPYCDAQRSWVAKLSTYLPKGRETLRLAAGRNGLSTILNLRRRKMP
jgi:hypothetical protein